MIKFLWLLLISLVSFYSHGYLFSTGDQSTYVPQVLKRVNPDLYQRDYLTQTAEGDLSFMFPLMAGIIRLTHIDIEWLYFLLYFLWHLLIILAIYQLSLTLTGSRRAALLASLVLSLPKFVAGTNQTTLDSLFLPRFFVLPLFLLTLDRLVQGRFIPAAFLTGVVFSFHPYSGIYLGLFILGLLLARHQIKILPQVIISGLLGSSIFVITALPQYLHRNSQFIMDQNWFSIITQRLPYNLLAHWPITAWVALAIPLLGIWLYHSRLAIISVITATGVTLIHFVLGEIFKVALIFQLQLPRIWLIPTYLGYISWAAVVIQVWRRSAWGKLTAVILATLLLTNFTKFRPSLIEWPGSYSREWDKLQLWAKANTPVDSLFLTLPHRIGWRIHSQRSIVAEIKDGSSGLYAYDLARTWQERISDTHPLAYKTGAEILKLQQKYNFDYLVTFNQNSYLDFTLVYKTDTFTIYEF